MAPLVFEKDEAAETKRAYIERLEGFYHAVILTMLWSAGVNVRAEELTNKSRRDSNCFQLQDRIGPAEKEIFTNLNFI